MRRCHFLGPHFFSPPQRWQPDPLLCLLCIHSLCPRTSRLCEGERSRPHAESSDGRLLSHGIKHLFNHPADAGAGSAPRRERPRFCVSVCLGSSRTPREAREARAATPEEAGPRRRLRLAISRPPPPPSSVPLHRGRDSFTLSRALRPPLPGSPYGRPPT